MRSPENKEAPNRSETNQKDRRADLAKKLGETAIRGATKK
jgi:hypothetical protein